MSKLVSSQSFEKPVDWKTYYKDDKVEISYKYAHCVLPSEGLDEDNIYFRYSNLSGKAIVVKFEMESQYGSKCYNCTGGNPEFMKMIRLNPGQVLAGDCTGIISGEFKILSKLNNVPNTPQLSNFKLKNISALEL